MNVTQALITAGLKQNATSTDIIVASQGQAALFYVEGRDAGRIAALARFLQTQPWADVVFTRGPNREEGSVPGTLSLDLIHASHPSRAADVAVTLAWTSNENQFGVKGTSTIHSSTPGPVAGGASGHGGLSPWVVRNTLVAWGADFKPRTRIDAPASLADVMPTVLAILGVKEPCTRSCGRVLREALKDGPAPGSIKTSRRVVRATAGAYRASVEISRAPGSITTSTAGRGRDEANIRNDLARNSQACAGRRGIPKRSDRTIRVKVVASELNRHAFRPVVSRDALWELGVGGWELT